MGALELLERYTKGMITREEYHQELYKMGLYGVAKYEQDVDSFLKHNLDNMI